MEHIRISGILHLFLLFLFSMIFMWIGITYVSQNISYNNAQKFFGGVVRELENNYFSDDAVLRCREWARENGYQLEIEEYGTKEHKDAKVVLAFTFTFPIIQKTQTMTMEGYAR